MSREDRSALPSPSGESAVTTSWWLPSAHASECHGIAKAGWIRLRSRDRYPIHPEVHNRIPSCHTDANVDHPAGRRSVGWSEDRGSSNLQSGIPQELRSRARGAVNGQRDGQVVGMRMLDRQINHSRSNGARYGGCFNLDGRELPREDLPRNRSGPGPCRVEPRLFLEVLEAVSIGFLRAR